MPVPDCLSTSIRHLLESQPGWLATIQDYLDDVRSPQRQTNHVAYIARIDSLLCGNLLYGAVGPAVEKLLPPKSAGKRFHENIVDVKSWCDSWHGAAVWRHDELTPASPTKCDWNVNREIVFAHYAAAFR
jgi:hypothetical protein